MSKNLGNIDIIREDGVLKTVSLIMPIWDKEQEDETLSVSIPFMFMQTTAKDESDVDRAVSEAVHLFCINAERFGKGLETELKIMGWSFVDSKTTADNHIVMAMDVKSKNLFLKQVLQTGEAFSQKLDITE